MRFFDEVSGKRVRRQYGRHFPQVTPPREPAPPSPMSRPDHRQNQNSQQISIGGRPRPYIECRRVQRTDYYLLDAVGNSLRNRYLAFDPCRGFKGEYVLFQTWPAGPVTSQFLRVLGRLRNDCLPRLIGRQWRGDHVDVVLTWTEGITLDKYFENIREGRRQPVAPAEAVRLIRGLANAVCKLHHKPQVAHGDIQPANVIITDHTSRLVLIDFGSAWTTDMTKVREEGDGLNRFYAAPELQCEGSLLFGFLADQFSVSVLLYQMLTQQLPYGGIGGKAGRPEHIDRARDHLQAPSQVSPGCRNLPRLLREGVDCLALRGLALSARDRYPDRHAWLNDLAEVHARFSLPPELPPVESTLTRFISGLLSRWPKK